jgi:hypothetical protein
MDDQSQKAVYKDQATQDMLNNPVASDQAFPQEDEDFLQLMLGLLEKGVIKPLIPSSLLNQAVYEKMTDMAKGRADMEAMNMLAAIRDIKGLCDTGHRQSLQVQNLVHKLRVTKERLEEIADIFVI